MSERGRVAILVVDIQKDFTEAHDGALAVPGADHDYLEAVRAAVGKLKRAGFPVIATQDWHPEEHVSFHTSHPEGEIFKPHTLADGRTQMMWPEHCVRESGGAELTLDPDVVNHTVKKGMDRGYDSYSGFRDDGGKETGLHGLLQKENIKTVVVFGLATDYCVLFTVKHAREHGYNVALIKELSRGVAPDTTEAALREMADLGVQVWDKFDLEKIKSL